MNKANQATGATKSPTPNEFKAKGVAHRKAPSVFGKSGTPDNRDTGNRNKK